MSGVSFTKIHDGRVYGYNETGPKWRCDVCSREGYGDPNVDRHRWVHWSDSCKRGHSPCAWCGRQLSLRKDGTPRVHARCPERPDEAELARLVSEEMSREVRLAIRGPAASANAALIARLIAARPS